MCVIDKQTKEETEQVVDQCVPVYHGIFMPIELNFFFHRIKTSKCCTLFRISPCNKNNNLCTNGIKFFIEYKYERSKCNYPFVTLYYKKLYMFFYTTRLIMFLFL